ncbi:MAG: hypothetical protein JXB32_23835 [Deltaproteobacteria bacterium]|nr:hypothetical protein [Deltaproteobacteria bacterium]
MRPATTLLLAWLPGALATAQIAEPGQPIPPPEEPPAPPSPEEPPPVAPEAAAVAVVVPRNVGTVSFGNERLGIPVVTVATGVTVTSDGAVATARAAVAGAPFVLLSVPGSPELLPAGVSLPPDSDVAFLLPAPRAAAAAAPSAADVPVAAGQRLTVFAVTPGPQGAQGRSIEATVRQPLVYGLHEVAIPAAPGVLGAPVLDEAGRWVGVVIMRHRDDPELAYVLPTAGLAAAQQLVETAAGFTALRAAAPIGDLATAVAGALDPRWLRPEGPPVPLPAAPSTACAAAAPPDAGTRAGRLRRNYGDDASGLAALLAAMLDWNTVICDLQRLGMPLNLLVREEVLAAWREEGNPALDRLKWAVDDCRRSAAFAPDLATSSEFSQTVLGLGEVLRVAVAEPGTLPAVPPPVPLPEGPEGPAGLPETPPTPEAPAERTYPDPDPSRVIWTSTALLRREHTWNIRSTDIGMWNFDYTLNPHVELGAAVTVPIMNVGVTPTARFATEVADGVSLGLSTQLGCWFLYPDVEFVVLVWGATPSLTIGSHDAFLNLALGVWGITVFDQHVAEYDDMYGDDDFTAVLFLPSIGGSYRVSRMVKLNAELLAPGLVDQDGESVFDYGEVWTLIYGVRIMGESIYGDVSFVVPMFEQAWYVLRYVPFGFPFLHFGVQW